MGRESVVLRLTLPPRAATGVDVVPVLLDDDGVPRPDARARAVDVLSEQSREFGVTVAEAGGRFEVRASAGA